VEEGSLSMGQDAGLIHDIPPAADIVTRIAQEANEILASKLPRFLKHDNEIKGAADAKVHH
jgi:NAD(P)H-dependent flavin oxidoreductase YrpB (nitropropane dioxygenase family)